MRIIRARNVNGAFNDGMHLLDEWGLDEPSRAGPVKVAPWPVTTIYEIPCERVLLEPKRDANPFFHLMEGLWMLAGRNDAAYLNRYVATFGERFAEPTVMFQRESDRVIHDAYGHRWRRAFGFDQLVVIVKKLRDNPQDRQCVLQMWDATAWDEMDLATRTNDSDVLGQDDLQGDWVGRPCNTHAYFRVQEEKTRILDAEIQTRSLDMTICCRSNDAIWGAHGANAVHFSMLLEYLAGKIGVEVGTMYQVSNNYHAYIDETNRIGDPVHLTDNDPYEDDAISATPMGTDWWQWDDDLRTFMLWHDRLWGASGPTSMDGIFNEWFLTTAAPVALARFQWCNALRKSALKTVESIESTDWRRACVEWMGRRHK